MLEPTAVKVTATEDKVSPASAVSLNENKPMGELEATAVMGEVISEAGAVVMVTAAKTGVANNNKPAKITIFFMLFLN